MKAKPTERQVRAGVAQQAARLRAEADNLKAENARLRAALERAEIAFRGFDGCCDAQGEAYGTIKRTLAEVDEARGGAK